MHIAYLISAHTDAPQLRRLVDALQPDAHYFVHIDKKSDISPFVALLNRQNVHFLDERIDVRWGTILEVDYQMLLIKAALDYPLHFDRLMTLSGLDYPLWNNTRISQYFQQMERKEILSGFDLSTPGVPDENTIIYRLPRPFFAIPFLSNQRNQQLSILGRVIRTILGKPLPKKLGEKLKLRKPLVLPNGWHLYKGAAWWAISEELGRYVYETYNARPELRQYFTDSFGQAETVVQTIVFNHPEWKQKCILFKHQYPGLVALTPLHFIIYAGAIRIMSEIDYQMLIDSDKMFTRKLMSGKSEQLIQMLETKRNEDENQQIKDY